MKPVPGVDEDDALLLLRACRWDVARYNEAREKSLVGRFRI